MKNFKSTVKNYFDIIMGKAKTGAGKATGSEKMELKGKIQTAKGNISEKADVGKVIDKAQESIAGKINDMTDKAEKE
jgi:uncharacterized protein YjbJ (UPF0337 family)